jgi:hypothetical protein
METRNTAMSDKELEDAAATHLERLKYCRDAIGITIVNGDTPAMKLSKILHLLPTFCISKVFSRPATFYLVLKNDAECPFFEPPVDVFRKRFKRPILIKSKVIHKWAATPLEITSPPIHFLLRGHAGSPVRYVSSFFSKRPRSPLNASVVLL